MYIYIYSPWCIILYNYIIIVVVFVCQTRANIYRCVAATRAVNILKFN